MATCKIFFATQELLGYLSCDYLIVPHEVHYGKPHHAKIIIIPNPKIRLCAYCLNVGQRTHRCTLIPQQGRA